MRPSAYVPAGHTWARPVRIRIAAPRQAADQPTAAVLEHEKRSNRKHPASDPKKAIWTLNIVTS